MNFLNKWLIILIVCYLRNIMYDIIILWLGLFFLLNKIDDVYLGVFLYIGKVIEYVKVSEKLSSYCF